MKNQKNNSKQSGKTPAKQPAGMKNQTQKPSDNQPAKNARNKQPQKKKAAGKPQNRENQKARKKQVTETAAVQPERTAAANMTQDQKKAKTHRKKHTGNTAKNNLKIIMLGGLGEIGKNMTVIEYKDDIIVIDCGIAFPNEDMPGIDFVIPDTSYLENNKDKIRGILLTHGHEDHIGAIPYVLRNINPPIYGTKLTIGIVEKKLEEHTLPFKPDLHSVSAGDTVQLGCFKAEFIHVNHSIADACCIAVKTPAGVVVHSGDFKLDTTPIDGNMMDIARLGEIGNKGVLLLLCESTNAERPGFTPSEKKVGQSLYGIFDKNKDKRIVIATFSSNVHRVQQIIDLSIKYGRKVAVTGRSLITILGAATELGYMDIPSGVIIDLNEIDRYRPDQLTVITTGSQGEPMSALSRMASAEHSKIQLGKNDLVVISANPIPGNEKLVGKVINSLLARGVSVLYDAVADVHVSGHACQEELKLFHALLKPKFFIPIHGEYKHMYSHRILAESMGMSSDRILITSIGKVIEVSPDGMKETGSVQSGNVLVDGLGIGDVESVVLRDRNHLSQAGLVVIVASIDMQDKQLISGPDIVSRGFVYAKEAEDLMENTKQVAYNAIQNCLDRNVYDYTAIKTRVKEDCAKYIAKNIKRNPIILPIIMGV